MSVSLFVCYCSSCVYTAKQHAQVHVRMCMHLHQKWAEFPLPGSCLVIHPGNYLYLAESPQRKRQQKFTLACTNHVYNTHILFRILAHKNTHVVFMYICVSYYYYYYYYYDRVDAVFPKVSEGTLGEQHFTPILRVSKKASS